MATHAKESATPRINPDRLTGEAGAHPIATGIGAVFTAATGLAIAAVVGSSLGGVAALAGGAFIGGYLGKAIGEILQPTDDVAFWRDNHPHQAYAREETLAADHTASWRAGYRFMITAHDFLARSSHRPPPPGDLRRPRSQRQPNSPRTRAPTGKPIYLSFHEIRRFH